MPQWIYVCCPKPLPRLSAARLRAGIDGRDPKILAGVDYMTLAEDYPVGECGELALEVEASKAPGVAFEVGFAPWPARTLSLHRWSAGTREGRAVVAMLHARGAPFDEVAEIFGVQLWRHQLADMGVVVAYEVARFLAQLGDASILGDQGHWQAVERGAWRPLLPRAIERTTPRTAQQLFVEPRDFKDEAAAWLATRPAKTAVASPSVADALLDDAMDCGAMNSFEQPPEVVRRLRQRVAALPRARAEPLVAPPGGVRWRFVVDQPTPYVVERAVAEVAGWPRVTNMYVRDQAIAALPRLGATAVAPLVAALAQRSPQRLVLLASLAALASPDAADTLSAHLRDPLERVRLVARWGLALLARKRQKSTARWCAGCGFVGGDDSCPWCGEELSKLPAKPWRALTAPTCPVDLRQS